MGDGEGRGGVRGDVAEHNAVHGVGAAAGRRGGGLVGGLVEPFFNAELGGGLNAGADNGECAAAAQDVSPPDPVRGEVRQRVDNLGADSGQGAGLQGREGPDGGAR